MSADGRATVGVRVGAPPADGKANAAVLKVLAKAWRLPKSSLRIVVGETARTKVIEIAGDADLAEAKIRAWMAELSG